MDETLTYIDSHFHMLSIREKGLDVDSIMDEMDRMGMEGIDIGTVADDLPERRKLLSGRSYALSAGIGPWGVGQDVKVLERMIAEYGPVCAIGEIGLDNHWKDYAGSREQEALFLAQVELAANLGLPTILHVRDADEQIRHILQSHTFPRMGIMHCFEGGRETCLLGLDKGFYISFSGVITYKGNAWMEDIVRVVPDDRLLLETDSPYLAPVPLRGKQNIPPYIVHTYREVARIRGISVGDLATMTKANLHAFVSQAHIS
jgi:TatD DNase family protein